ncbi:hypothetical protein BFW01_g3477 [Lasiodiplodia theobromae]|nr:hypothetical protein BFW01_g3477 [Lasiodiplodia theobromae]
MFSNHDYTPRISPNWSTIDGTIRVGREAKGTITANQFIKDGPHLWLTPDEVGESATTGSGIRHRARPHATSSQLSHQRLVDHMLMQPIDLSDAPGGICHDLDA